MRKSQPYSHRQLCQLAAKRAPARKSDEGEFAQKEAKRVGELHFSTPADLISLQFQLRQDVACDNAQFAMRAMQER